MARGDLGGTDLKLGDVDISKLEWSAEQRSESLNSLVAYTHRLAVDTREWYNTGKRSKQWWAKALRVAAIVATAIAGIIPILTEISETGGVPDIPAAWASVALAIAATCIGVDRFFGFSSGWLRYIEAQTKIRQAIQDFVIDCQMERMKWQNEQPDLEQSERLVGRAKALTTTINSIVENETKKWADEFRDALGRLEEAAEAIERAAPHERFGAINVTVTNGADCDDGWTVSVDGGSAQRRSGNTATISNLAPGLRALVIAGTLSDKPCQAEKSISVAAGMATETTLTLT